MLGSDAERCLTDVRISDKMLRTVVNHLHVVSGAGLADPIAAWLALDLSSCLLENVLDMRPCSGGTAGHERRAVAGTLLTTGDTTADEEETLGLKLLGTANGVGVVRVTTVDNDVTRLEVRDELLDESVDGRTSLDEQDDFTGALELGNELLNGVRALDLGALVAMRLQKTRSGQ